MAAPHRANANLLVTSSLAPPLLSLLLFFNLFPAATADGVDGGGGGGGGMTTTHLHFFFHEVFTTGPNGTTATVSSPPARGGGSSSSFGFVGVVDDMLKEGADPASRLIGRAQGLTAGTSRSDGALTTMLNLVFTDGPYNGSSLAVFGRALLGTAAMERPVIGGTGSFRMARGYTLSRMVNSSDPNNLLVLEYDVFVTVSSH